MPQLEAQIRDALSAGSPNTSAGSRVYANRANQGAAAPYVVIQRVGNTPNDTLDRPSTLDQVRMQVDCWASTVDGAAALASQVRSILEADHPFKARLRNQLDDFDVETKLHRRILEFRCWDRLS